MEKKCCLSIYQKMPTLRKSESRKILPKNDPKKSLRIIRKLRASTYGPANVCCCWVVLRMLMQVTSTVQWIAIAIRTKQNYAHSNLVHIFKIGCEITAAKQNNKLPNCTDKIIKNNTATCPTNIVKNSPKIQCRSTDFE